MLRCVAFHQAGRTSSRAAVDLLFPSLSPAVSTAASSTPFDFHGGRDGDSAWTPPPLPFVVSPSQLRARGPPLPRLWIQGRQQRLLMPPPRRALRGRLLPRRRQAGLPRLQQPLPLQDGPSLLRALPLLRREARLRRCRRLPHPQEGAPQGPQDAPQGVGRAVPAGRLLPEPRRLVVAEHARRRPRHLRLPGSDLETSRFGIALTVSGLGTWEDTRRGRGC